MPSDDGFATTRYSLIPGEVIGDLVPDQVRYALIVWETMRVLRDAAEPLAANQVMDAVRARIQPNVYESERVKSGGIRWEVIFQFKSGNAVTVGWMTKQGGWGLVEGGIGALEAFPAPDQLYAELERRSREVDQQRKQAMQALDDVHQFIAQALGVVVAGQWTAHDDLAELVGTSTTEVANFLASFKIQMPNAFRVLNADGSIPVEGMLHANYRGTDLRKRLTLEGVEFDASDRALQKQRLTAAALKELLDELRESERESDEEEVPAAKRAWMVRGTNVDGFNRVPDWLEYDVVTVSAAQLGDVAPGISYEDLKRDVDAAYEHKSYAYRGQRLEELDRFIRRMRAGDLVVTPMQGGVYLGEITSGVRFNVADGLAGELYRGVEWRNKNTPVDASQLRAPVPALLQSQSTVVDLTEAYDQLADLFPGKPEEPAAPVRAIEKEQRTLAFRPVTAGCAADLLMEEGELRKIAELLWERKQVIFYGPPGTGKTYLAKTLGRHLTEDGAVKLVQFHPSYTYEDFFEGFRPKQADSGTGALSFELIPGPFRLFAETAKANPTTPYILIIDEINRANLAKVFGELYFLLEYRDEAISLQYSPKEEFTLPENLFVIGTMNTADRSIARIDAAMRRRFAFIELDPRIPPVQGLLSRWLVSRELPNESALLLDALNVRLSEADPDAAIGPSYLMRSSVYAREDGLDRVWGYEIMPLLADLFYGQRDLGERYGLSALRRATGTATPSEPPAPPATDPPDSPQP
jgi:5-methylcytosine-specific restriction protein B